MRPVCIYVVFVNSVSSFYHVSIHHVGSPRVFDRVDISNFYRETRKKTIHRPLLITRPAGRIPFALRSLEHAPAGSSRGPPRTSHARPVAAAGGGPVGGRHHRRIHYIVIRRSCALETGQSRAPCSGAAQPVRVVYCSRIILIIRYYLNKKYVLYTSVSHTHTHLLLTRAHSV